MPPRDERYIETDRIEQIADTAARKAVKHASGEVHECQKGSQLDRIESGVVTMQRELVEFKIAMTQRLAEGDGRMNMIESKADAAYRAVVGFIIFILLGVGGWAGAVALKADKQPDPTTAQQGKQP